MELSEDTTVAGLLRQYPDGFSVGPGGQISKILFATSHFYAMALKTHGVVEGNQGFLFVDMTSDRVATATTIGPPICGAM